MFIAHSNDGQGGITRGDWCRFATVQGVASSASHAVPTDCVSSIPATAAMLVGVAGSGRLLV